MVAKPLRILYVEVTNSRSKQIIAGLFSDHPDLVLAGCAESYEEALEFCEALNPDIVLIELVSPEISHIDAVRVIRFNHAHIKVVVLSQAEDIDTARAMLNAGISGYLLKHRDLSGLAAAIRAINSGIEVFSPTIAPTLIHIRSKN
jgi:DNA-binding NarL/FixJ family response regulator